MGSVTVVGSYLLLHCLYLTMALGFYVLLFGTQTVIARVRQSPIWRTILDLCLILLVSVISIVTELPVIAIILSIAALSMPFGRELCTRKLLRRALAEMIVLIAVEIVMNYYLFSRYGKGASGGTILTGLEQTLMCVLMIVLVQKILVMIVFGWKFRRQIWISFFIAVVFKTMVNGAWITAQFTHVKGLYRLSFFATYWFFTIIDYFLLYCLEWLGDAEKEKHLRVSAPFNREEYYLNMEEEHLQIRRMYHDMKNQLMILKEAETARASQAEDYILQMARRMEEVEHYYHTGNQNLNILLYESRKRSEERQIDFDANIQENCLSFMKDEDVQAIFVNAISNAIEACEKIETGPRKIEIMAGEHLNDILISFRNTKREGEHRKDLKTTKENKRMHGIGLASIQRAADKYEGYVVAEDEKNYFRLTVLFVKE